MPAERPVALSLACVRAILDGRKTQLRHQVREPVPPASVDDCPLGRPGDRLWVREPWACPAGIDGAADLDAARWELHYEADAHFDPCEARNRERYGGAWRPAREMPRWACRLLLEIDRIRVERLRSICDADLGAEGDTWRESMPEEGEDDRAGFARWWSAAYAAPEADREHDPWVWVVEFHRPPAATA